MRRPVAPGFRTPSHPSRPADASGACSTGAQGSSARSGAGCQEAWTSMPTSPSATRRAPSLSSPSIATAAPPAGGSTWTPRDRSPAALPMRIASLPLPSQHRGGETPSCGSPADLPSRSSRCRAGGPRHRPLRGARGHLRRGHRVAPGDPSRWLAGRCRTGRHRTSDKGAEGHPAGPSGWPCWWACLAAGLACFGLRPRGPGAGWARASARPAR